MQEEVKYDLVKFVDEEFELNESQVCSKKEHTALDGKTNTATSICKS